MAARLPPLCCSCLRSRNPDISTGGRASGLSMRFTLRKLLVLLRVVKLGFLFSLDPSVTTKELDPVGPGTRRLSALFTLVPKRWRKSQGNLLKTVKHQLKFTSMSKSYHLIETCLTQTVDSHAWWFHPQVRRFWVASCKFVDTHIFTKASHFISWMDFKINI